tara:strand:- start:564 stop:983 length:420 start_codon:yes stop_codon:yes gene_type:complete
METNGETSPPVTEEMEAPAKRRKGDKGMPKGIIEHRTGKYQARLSWKDGTTNKTVQRFIPGLFMAIEDAVIAQAAAQELFDSGGVEAVWPPKFSETRNKRGEVSRAGRIKHLSRPWMTHKSALALVCVAAGSKTSAVVD